ncbi:MAG: PEP-CTERM sorting domain-containing protein [Desulfobacteraceae bacterium]|jgi:hypothetical protein
MKIRKTIKSLALVFLFAGFLAFSSQTASASEIYASSIIEGTTAHNWDGTCHGTLDASVILGAPTGAMDGTGFTGWGSGESGYIELGFDQVFTDGAGDDLFVYGFGPGSNAYISVSSDGDNWSATADLGWSMPGAADVWGYDLFTDFGVTSAQYVRLAAGPAKFIDAVEATNPVPVPGAVWLLGSGLLGLIGLRRKK